ncbi:methylase, partial [Novosphingobium sp. H3SJ31-1]|nr:methylase [Novosphingobium album (ex Liu et al. 2023)]
GAATYRPSKLTPTGLRNRRATDTAILGRIIYPRALGKLQAEFGLADGAIALTPHELLRGADAPGGVAIPGLKPAHLVRVTVNNSRRIEIRDYPPERRSWLKSCGAFSEVIGFRTRLFLPPEQAEAILRQISAERS